MYEIIKTTFWHHVEIYDVIGEGKSLQCVPWSLHYNLLGLHICGISRPIFFRFGLGRTGILMTLSNNYDETFFNENS